MAAFCLANRLQFMHDDIKIGLSTRDKYKEK